MVIPPQFQDFAWACAGVLITGGVGLFGYVVRSHLNEVSDMKKKTDYLMGEDKLSKEMIAFYEKEENNRRFAERRHAERRRGRHE